MSAALRRQHQSDGHLPTRRRALAPLKTLAATPALPRPLTPKPPSATASPVVAFPITAAPAAANRTNGPGYGRPPQRAAPKLSWPPRQGDAAGRPVSPGPLAGGALGVEAGRGSGRLGLKGFHRSHRQSRRRSGTIFWSLIAEKSRIGDRADFALCGDDPPPRGRGEAGTVAGKFDYFGGESSFLAD